MLIQQFQAALMVTVKGLAPKGTRLKGKVNGTEGKLPGNCLQRRTGQLCCLSGSPEVTGRGLQTDGCRSPLILRAVGSLAPATTVLCLYLVLSSTGRGTPPHTPTPPALPSQQSVRMGLEILLSLSGSKNRELISTAGAPLLP